MRLNPGRKAKKIADAIKQRIGHVENRQAEWIELDKGTVRNVEPI